MNATMNAHHEPETGWRYPAGGYGSGWYFIRAVRFLLVVSVVTLAVLGALGVWQAMNAAIP